MLITQGTQTLLTYPDTTEYAPRGQLTRVYRLPIRLVAPTLHKLNRLGASIAFTVNETASRDRKMQSITRIRAYFTEIDGIPTWQDKQDKMTDLLNSALPPSAIVESKNGLHAYWYSTGEETVDPIDYKRINTRIATHHNGDTNAVDISRVLRLPNFKHMKDPKDPFTVRLRHQNKQAIYTREQILNAFPATPNEDETMKTAYAPTPPVILEGEDRAIKYIRAALNNQTQNMRNTAPNSGNRNNTLNAAAYSLARLIHTGYITSEDIYNSLAPAAKQTGLPGYEIDSTIRAAIEAGSRNPRPFELKGHHQ